MNADNKNILIAYYSRSGYNYVGGSITHLPVGNTEVIARMIQEMTGGDLFKIETVDSYPEDYTQTTEVAQSELNMGARPELSTHVENIDKYDTIFIGYPNWWGTMPMPVFTFFEEYDLSGKVIIPFCTHEGSGLSRSVKDIEKLNPNSEVFPALAIRGGSVKSPSSRKSVEMWLKDNDIL
jgi:flavodoxin